MGFDLTSDQKNVYDAIVRFAPAVGSRAAERDDEPALRELRPDRGTFRLQCLPSFRTNGASSYLTGPEPRSVRDPVGTTIFGHVRHPAEHHRTLDGPSLVNKSDKELAMSQT